MRYVKRKAQNRTDRTKTNWGRSKEWMNHGADNPVAMAVNGDFTPVLAKHTKTFNLVDTLSVGVDRIPPLLARNRMTGAMSSSGVPKRPSPLVGAGTLGSRPHVSASGRTLFTVILSAAQHNEVLLGQLARTESRLRWKKIHEGCQERSRSTRLSSRAGAGSHATLLHFRSRDKYFP